MVVGNVVVVEVVGSDMVLAAGGSVGIVGGRCGGIAC